MSMNLLTAALNQNTRGLVSWGATLVKSVQVTTDLNKTFISAGKMNMINSENLGKTFSKAGMSMQASIEMYKTMFTAGIDANNKTTKEMLSKFSLLGKDVKAAASLYAFNTQTLGLSTKASALLNESLLETGAAYHIDSNVLVKSLNNLASTLVSTSTTYGAETAAAVQLATTNMIGKYGATNSKLVEELAKKLFAGNAESSKMAAVLGLDISNMATKSAGQAQQLMEQALMSLKSKVGAAAGDGTSGFVLPQLIAAFGATPGMLALANLGPQFDAAAGMTAEQLAAQQAQHSLSQSMEFLMGQLVFGLVPVVQAIAPVVQGIVSLLTIGNGVLIKLLVAMGVMKTFAFMTSQAEFFQRHFAAKSLMNDRHALGKQGEIILSIHKNTLAVRQASVTKGLGDAATVGFLGRAAGFLGGPWGMAIAAGISFIPGLFESSKKVEEGQTSSLDELKKQTEILTDSKSNKLLKMIEQGITQTNIYSALISKLSEEQLEAFNAAPAVSPNPVNTQTYSLPSTITT